MKEFELPERITKVLERLNAAGYEAYVIGGAVRDFLLEKKPHDFDVATSATPEETLEVFADLPNYQNGIKHGTVSIILNHEAVEITTFRTDGSYQDARHPDSVHFIRSLKEDVMRRDFTINGMAYSPKSGVIDYVGGQKDLQRKLIRTIGDPEIRFQEDALRILRALRFSSRLHFSLEEKTKEAIFKKQELLSRIAQERLTSEFEMILSEEGALEIVQEYASVMHYVADLPFEKLTLKNGFFEKSDSLEIRLAALLNDMDASDPLEALKRMKLPKRTIHLVTLYLNDLKADLSDELKQAEVLRSLTDEEVEELLSLKSRLGAEDVSLIRQSLNDMREKGVYSVAQLALHGNELSGVAPALRQGVLNTLLEKVVRKEIKNRREDLLRYVEEMKKDA